MKRSTLRRFVPRPTYANVIASIALFVALGGAAIAAGLPRNSVGPNQLKRGAVTPAKIRKNAVTAGKLAPGAVTPGKLGANAVLPGNLGNGIISTAKLADSAVIAAKIRNGSVTTNKLNNGAVNAAKLADDAVNVNKLGNNAVTAAKLANKAVTPEKLSFAVSTPGTVSTLAPGQTLRGVIDVGGTAVAANDVAKGAVSYAMPLAAPPQVTILKPGEATASCPGLGVGASSPIAAPGNLCIYLGLAPNLNEAELPKLVEANTRLGFGLAVKAKAAGEFFALGNWAVTAPE
ncbi:MAG TPA: hypothetical protein VEB65_03765 [Solirubrobacterales bacterium]|nr:hypothetical protein [Solirubrobacterales bacterium]